MPRRACVVARASARDDPPCSEGCEILEELSQVKAKVFRWGPTCEFVLEIDPHLLPEEEYVDMDHWRDILVPCKDLSSEYSSEQLLVTISGYRYNCCFELQLPYVDPGFGCKFEITAIDPIN